MSVIDVSDPLAPVLLGRYDTPGYAQDVASVSGYGLVADGYDGLQIVRPNPSLRDLFVEPDAIRLTVPAGFTPGPYHLQVTTPAGETDTLFNGLLACERRALTADLEPVLDAEPPVVDGTSVPWRMTLEGDDLFFEPKVRHVAVLALPALPASLETRYQAGDGSGRMAIELILTADTGSGVVVLEGDDPGRVAALWQQIESAGECALPRRGSDSYGDVVLRVTRPGATWPSADPPLVRYRYLFSAAGDLAEARAWGDGVDLVFEAVGNDEYRCETADTIRFVDTLRALCDELGNAHPELAAVDCP